MKTKLVCLAIIVIGLNSVMAQVGIGTTTPNASAALEVKSTSQGFLPPRMTANDRNLIAIPVPGLMIYNTTTNQLNFFNATQWTNMNGVSAPNAPAISAVTSGNGQVDVVFTAPAENGGSTITTYTATSNPGGITGSISQAGSGTITVSGLTNGTAYTFTVTATNDAGTSIASAASASVTPLSYAVGDSFGGGKVAYILQVGDPGYDENVQHGLIAALSDQSSGIRWFNGIDIITGATNTALGNGLLNTNIIIENQGGTPTSYAAGIARAHNGGGYTDWYLPSKDELNKLFLNRAVIGGFNTSGGDGKYWSSSESSSGFAWFQLFFNGGLVDGPKSDALRIRAVRSF